MQTGRSRCRFGHGALGSILVALAALPGLGDFTVDRSVMPEEYWRNWWNDAQQKRTEANIEKYRKADAAFDVHAPEGTKVRVEQVSHSFRFGAHAFRMGRLPTAEINRRYEENFLRLFNQATIGFYWREFEISPGDLHLHTRIGDLESSFTSGFFEKMDPHSRYLASPARSTDQSLEFAKRHGLIVHGHPLVWGSEEWMMPFWIYDQYCPEEEKSFLRLPQKDLRAITRLFAEWNWISAYRARIKELFSRYSEAEIAARCPVYVANLKRLQAKRIAEVMDYCGDRVDSWDVVNESAYDWAGGCGRSCENGKRMTKSIYGIMPPNYTLEAFKAAAVHASARQKLAINDNHVDEDYSGQIADLLAHDARIDMIGVQFHVFNDADFGTICRGGGDMADPNAIGRLFARLGSSGRGVSLSEITLPSPGNTEESRQRQAIVAYNLYRCWFSQPSAVGITWWHTLDGANKAGGVENGGAGIMDAEANPKPVYFALDRLINREWRTRLDVVVKAGRVAFRGFRGRYRLDWKDADGNSQSEMVEVR